MIFSDITYNITTTGWGALFKITGKSSSNKETNND